jgi:hypothetical protein
MSPITSVEEQLQHDRCELGKRNSVYELADLTAKNMYEGLSYCIAADRPPKSAEEAESCAFEVIALSRFLHEMALSEANLNAHNDTIASLLSLIEILGQRLHQWTSRLAEEESQRYVEKHQAEDGGVS